MITDITRSLEMVETSRSIYWTDMFGHRKGSGRFRTFIGVPGVTGTPPVSVWALLGLSGIEEEEA